MVSVQPCISRPSRIDLFYKSIRYGHEKYLKVRKGDVQNSLSFPRPHTPALKDIDVGALRRTESTNQKIFLVMKAQ